MGAACLVARAAHRAGAGLVTLATPESVYPIVAAQLTETIHLPLPEDGDGRIHPEAAHMLREELSRYDALAVGSGMGRSDGVADFVETLLLAGRSPDLPVLVDADGLNSLARLRSWWRRRSGPLVLTPHPGEMATLTGLSTAEVQGDRIGAARQWAGHWQSVVVLKGAFTAVAEPGALSDGELPSAAPSASPPSPTPAWLPAAPATSLPALSAASWPRAWTLRSCQLWRLSSWPGRCIDNRKPGSVGLLASEVAEALPHAIHSL